MDRIEFGNKISTLRKEKGMTQKQLAECIHVSDKAVSKWERGINYPDFELMESIAAAFDLTVPELFDLKKESINETLKMIHRLTAKNNAQLKNRIKKLAIINVILLFVLFFSMYILLGHIIQINNVSQYTSDIINGILNVVIYVIIGVLLNTSFGIIETSKNIQ